MARHSWPRGNGSPRRGDMPVVFVHGVPDTQLVWDPAVSRLDRRDVLRVSLPGFGCPVPDGFSATKEAYVDWLIGELARLPGPIDVVGHDWGALLTVRVVSLRPTLVRSWAAGGAPLDREYVWHQAAQAWQTPGKGEQVMAMMTPQTMTAALAAAGVPPADAAETAAPRGRHHEAVHPVALPLRSERGRGVGGRPAAGVDAWT